MTLEAKDKDGWPLVEGGIQRANVDRPCRVVRLLPAVHTAPCKAKQAEFAKKFPGAPAQDCDCKRPREWYTPTHECAVLRLVPHPKHGVVVEVRDVSTHGLHTVLPSQIKVAQGETKAWREYREFADAGYRAVSKSRRAREDV